MILESLQKKQLEYFKQKDAEKVGVLRFLIAAIKNKEIELRPSGEELTDEIIGKVIKKQIKMRVDAIEGAEKADRQDLIDKESSEKEILEGILYEYFGEDQQ
ncbi:GatB/YqeY domain-containing protein [Patescibacteria group bacterium]